MYFSQASRYENWNSRENFELEIDMGVVQAQEIIGTTVLGITAQEEGKSGRQKSNLAVGI